jgi:hypothetical protein
VLPVLLIFHHPILHVVCHQVLLWACFLSLSLCSKALCHLLFQSTIFFGACYIRGTTLAVTARLTSRCQHTCPKSTAQALFRDVRVDYVTSTQAIVDSTVSPCLGRNGVYVRAFITMERFLMGSWVWREGGLICRRARLCNAVRPTLGAMLTADPPKFSGY